MWQSLHQENNETVAQWMDYYSKHSGKNYVVQKKYEYTENPSIQGMWNPFVNANPEIATAKFPVVSCLMSRFIQELHLMIFQI